VKPLELTTAASAYFAWKHVHPHESEEPTAVWGAAWRAGGRAALQDSARLVDLVPVLRELLCLLEDGRVEDVLRRTDRRPQPAWNDDAEVAF
jgi:hypothetical protein